MEIISNKYKPVKLLKKDDERELVLPDTKMHYKCVQGPGKLIDM